jgi:hypothetical protein
MRGTTHGMIAAGLALSLVGCAPPATAQVVVHADDIIYLGGGVSARAADLLYTTITPNWNMIAAERRGPATASPRGRRLGSDFSKEELALQGQVVRGQIPVHGYWVNWEDVFFYTGDTPAVNQFLEAYGKLEQHQFKVVIHAGTRGARSPWDQADRGPADWSFYRWNAGSPQPGAKPAPSRVDVWLGSRIKLAELRVPANVEVVSGGEIESFIAGRKNPAPGAKQNDLTSLDLLKLSHLEVDLPPISRGGLSETRIGGPASPK